MIRDAYDERRIRPDIIEALDAWGDGSGPFLGGFLTAVLSNNLVESVGRADADNLATLPAIVTYIYRMLPAECWGSPETVRAWRHRHLERLREASRDEAEALKSIPSSGKTTDG